MHRRLHRRQNQQLSSLFSEPTGIAGVTGDATATAGATASASLLMASNTASAVEATAPPLIVGGDTLTISTQAPSSSTATSTLSSPSSAVKMSSSENISMGTVIGACVGAFAACAAVILLAVWWYKRSGRRPTRGRGMSNALDSHRNSQRIKTRLEPWNKLNEKDQVDVWEGMLPAPSSKGSSTKEVIALPAPVRTVTPASATLDKLGGMFKKTPSIRSADGKSLTSYGHDDFGDQLASTSQIAQYHPHLAEELAKTVMPMRAALTRQDSSAISWGGDTVSGDDAYFNRSMNSPLLSIASEVMSPTYVNVKTTPTATASQPHVWESAEVMHHDESEPQNPFADVQAERSSSDRKSLTNPFFNARGSSSMPRRPVSNPFADDARSARSLTHSVDEDSEDRMQSLIAALNITPEAQERARIASMHPSILSTGSAYDDDTSVADFPLPPTPSTPGSRSEY